MRQFNGKLHGKKLNDFDLSELKAVPRYEDRLKNVESLINGEDGEVHQFFTTYYSTYFNSSPSQDDYLSEDNAVSKLIEIIGTYLLSASDIESERKITYRFWKSERDFRKSKEYENVNTSALSVNSDNGEDIIDMFVDRKNNKNHVKIKPTTISKKDIAEMLDIRALNRAIEYLMSRGKKDILEHISESILECDEDDVKRLHYIRRNVDRYINMYVKDLRDNQRIIKEVTKRPIQFQSSHSGFTPDVGTLDEIDFMEVNQVLLLLQLLSTDDLMSDIGILVNDLNKLIDKSKLSKRESEIVSLLREDLRQKDIATILGIKKQNVKTYMKRIAEKVVKTYEKQLSEYRESVRQKKVI